MKTTRLIASLLFVAPWALASAQEVARTPLPGTHPLIGVWRIDLPDMKCFEEYDVRADGTKHSQSGKERNESEFTISLVPSPKGFYKWVDKITKNNGQPDCSGHNTKVGHVAINYIRLHPNGQWLLLCEAEDMNSCFAEFYRKPQ